MKSAASYLGKQGPLHPKSVRSLPSGKTASFPSGDSGSALFGIAEGGHGVEIVGLLVSTWYPETHIQGSGVELRCGLFVPADVVFEQIENCTGRKWVPVL